MALDTLLLGPFTFTDFSVPDRMSYGGKHALHVNKMPGGGRVIDAYGPDDDDRSWSGILWGDDAMSKMQTLDAMRRSGIELPFSWGAESRTCVISEFKANVEKFTCIHYSITIILTDGGFTSLISSIDDMIQGDMASALSLVF
jgi:hypothetical protein